MTDNQDPTHRKQDSTVRERRISVVLLGVLAFVAAGMLWSQSRFDPGSWQEQARSLRAGGEDHPAATKGPPVSRAEDTAYDTAGVVPMAPAESYGPDTLSDKIDGKAELYLSAGFKDLVSRRFSLAGDRHRWMERSVYDMGAFQGAYAVFSSQRRPNSQPVTWTRHGYLAGNALFFVHGPYYVEIVGAEASQVVQKGLESLAKAFISANAVHAAEPVELQLLPRDHRAAHSIKLTAHAAFGIQGLDWVFSAAYASTPDRAEASAFVSRRDSPEEAAALADKFYAFWLEYGGTEIAPPAGPLGVRAITILDNYEICLARGRYLIGVHEATTLAFGMHLMEQLDDHIAGARR